MDAHLGLAELGARLNHLDAGAVLRISEQDYERLFGINEVAAERVAQFAEMHHCVSVSGANAVYFRKWSATQPELVQGDDAAFR